MINSGSKKERKSKVMVQEAADDANKASPPLSKRAMPTSFSQHSPHPLSGQYHNTLAVLFVDGQQTPVAKSWVSGRSLRSRADQLQT